MTKKKRKSSYECYRLQGEERERVRRLLGSLLREHAPCSTRTLREVLKLWGYPLSIRQIRNLLRECGAGERKYGRTFLHNFRRTWIIWSVK